MAVVDWPGPVYVEAIKWLNRRAERGEPAPTTDPVERGALAAIRGAMQQ